MFTIKKDEDEQDLVKLKEKKTKTRHSLLLIEMNRTMEFKKLDAASKVRRVSKFNNITPQTKHKKNSSNFSH